MSRENQNPLEKINEAEEGEEECLAATADPGGGGRGWTRTETFMPLKH